MNIEEIKKIKRRVKQNAVIVNEFYVEPTEVISTKVLYEILLEKRRNKNNNNQNYKLAWEELKNTTIFTESYPREHKMFEYYEGLFKELEEKHGIEVK